MNRWLCLGVAGLCGALVACGDATTTSRDATGTMVVQGSVSDALSVDNARAIAIGTNGRTFWAYLDKERDFKLVLPVGQSYRILVANDRAGGGQTVVGHLVLVAGMSKTGWLGANHAGSIVDLGIVRPTTSAGSVGVRSLESNDDATDAPTDHDDDNACHESHAKGGDGQDDEAKEGAADDVDPCSAGPEQELEPSNAPGKACEDDDHHGADDDGDKACSGGSSGESGESESGDD